MARLLLSWLFVTFAKPLVAMLALAISACAAAGLPPSLSDVGTTMQAPTGELRTGVRVSTGVHWASGTTRTDQDFDVGAGYVYERMEGAAGDIRDSSTAPPESALARESQGGYLSVARVLSRDPSQHYRTWLGVRAEYLHAHEDAGGPSLNLLARASWEIFGPAVGAGASSDSCSTAIGMAYGSVGLGVYVEAGARRSLEGEAAFIGTAGLSLRLPSLFGVAVGYCR